MKPRTRFFVEIGSIAAVGLFFIIVGAYIAGTSLGDNYSARGVVAGAGSIFLGAYIMWWIYQFTNPPKTALKPPETCPYCGALNEATATACKKCQRELILEHV